jgi:hypothetical protein
VSQCVNKGGPAELTGLTGLAGSWRVGYGDQDRAATPDKMVENHKPARFRKLPDGLVCLGLQEHITMFLMNATPITPLLLQNNRAS